MRMAALLLVFLFPAFLAADPTVPGPQDVVAQPQPQNRAFPIAVQVVVQDETMRTRIRESVLAELKKTGANIEVMAEPGRAVSTLWVYGAQTVGNRNPDGYTLAVAHTSSLLIRMATLKVNELKGVPGCAPTVTSPIPVADNPPTLDDVLAKLAVDWQPLKYLNTAALDTLDDASLDAFSRVIVANFLQRER